MEDNKLDLFIKIIRLTESDNDNQALVALRKANAMLTANGWDWDKLLRGKVKVIADPFANIQKSAPTPKAATFTQQPPQPKPDPFVQASQANFRAKPKPQTPPPPPPPRQPPQPKQMPLHFRKSPSGEWCIASYMRADQMTGQQVQLEKRDGTKSTETCGPFVQQCPSTGYYLYKIAKASKWQRKFVDQTTVDDLI